MNNAPNSYEAKRAERIERLRDRADRKRTEAEATLERARQLADVIPMGQPIIADHYSAGRDRRYRAKIDRTFTKGFEAMNESRELERRAAAAEANRVISSDDPDAIAKLQAKLDDIERERERATAINARIRAAQRRGDGWEAHARAMLAAMGVSSALIRAALERDFAGRYGVPAYRLTNLAAEARRIRERIAVLECEVTVEPVTFGAVRVEEADNRVRIITPGKPSAEGRALLKARGFRWAPSVGAWQRQATDNARRDARDVAGQLAEEET